jgi:hypothetical protein
MPNSGRHVVDLEAGHIYWANMGAWNHPNEVLRVACKVVGSVSISARYSASNQQ